MARVDVRTNLLTPPRWAGDNFSKELLLPAGGKVDPVQFFAEDSVAVVVGAAGAAANATSVPVAALSGPIPNGTTIRLGVKKFVTLTVAALLGDVTLTVEALATALVSGDAGLYPGIKANISIPSGTLLGRTYAERDAKTSFGPAADTDDEFYLLAFGILDANLNNDATLYRHNGLVKENYLPAFTTLSATQQAKIRTLYQTTIGWE